MASKTQGFSTELGKMFNRSQFDHACEEVAARYERTAPTVEQWCDLLASSRDHEITLADIRILTQLQTDPPQPNYAANMLYKHLSFMAKETTGQIGF